MQVTRVAAGWPVPSLMHRRRVMADRITYVGLDVHKESIVVAVAVGGLRGEVREYGRIANTAAALDRLMRKLSGEGVGLRFCYEAGPCGYGIQRHLALQKSRPERFGFRWADAKADNLAPAFGCDRHGD